MKNTLKKIPQPIQPITFKTFMDGDDAGTLFDVLISLVDSTSLTSSLIGKNNLQIIINMPLSGSIPQNASITFITK